MKNVPVFSQKFEALMGSWFGRISSAILDQAIFSGGTFILSVLLARWLGPVSFGAYTVAYAWLGLGLNLYDSLLTEPMAIYGSKKYAKQFRGYLGHLYYGHALLTLVIAIIMGIGAWFSYQYDTYHVFLAMAGAALAAPLFFTRWLTRQPFYVMSKPHWAAAGGFIFLVTNVALLAALRYAGIINSFNAMLVTGVAALAGAIFVTVTLLKPDFRLKNDELSKREILKDHYEYGRWAAPSRILAWLPGSIFFIVLPMAVSLEANATLSAVGSLFRPLFLMIQAIGGVMLPSFVRAYENHGLDALNARVKQVTLLGMLGIGLIALIFTVFGQQIVHIVYAGQYDEFTTFPIILTMALFPVIDVVQQMLDIGLRSMGLVRLTFIVKVVWGVGTVTIGIGMMLAYGLLGVNLGQLVTASIALFVTVWFYYKHVLLPIRNGKPEQSAL